MALDPRVHLGAEGPEDRGLGRCLLSLEAQTECDWGSQKRASSSYALSNVMLVSDSAM